jgi:hypothetical protein
MILRNVENFSPNETASHAGRLEYSKVGAFVQSRHMNCLPQAVPLHTAVYLSVISSIFMTTDMHFQVVS